MRSPGGIAAWLVQERSLPIVTIRFAFDGGSAQEPAGKEGTAGLLAAMLDQGAGNLSGTAYQKQMEKLAARISFDSDRDAFFGSFETLTANLAKASELLKLAVNAADARAGDAGAHARAVPGARLARGGRQQQAGQRAMDGAVVRRATPTRGRSPARPNSIKAVTREDLDGYRKRIMARRTLRVAAVGDIDAATLGKVLDDVFGALAGRAAADAHRRCGPQGGAEAHAW